MLGVLERVGLLPDLSDDLRDSLTAVRRACRAFGPEQPTPTNLAKQLALNLVGRSCVIYGSAGRMEVVARRWAGQIAENGKLMATFNSFPEMSHNELVGWQHPADSLSSTSVVLLHDHDDHPRIETQLSWVRDYLDTRAGRVMEFFSTQDRQSDRFWELILLGDYASVYVGILNGEDPARIEAIEELKSFLSQRNSHKDSDS